MKTELTIVEVGPRDGLQNEKKTVSVDVKLEFIKKLTDSGLKYIEAGSFVSPKWVPQMAETDVLMKRLLDLPDVHYCALVPNEIGLQKAIECQVKDIAVFAAASETFSKKNINQSINHSINQKINPPENQSIRDIYLRSTQNHCICILNLAKVQVQKILFSVPW